MTSETRRRNASNSPAIFDHTKCSISQIQRDVVSTTEQEMRVSYGTGLLDLKHSTRCLQLSSDFDTSAQRQQHNRIPGHNRVCKIVTTTVGRRRASSSKASRRFTSSYPRHPSVSSRTRCYLVSLNSFSRKLMGKGGCLFGGMFATDVPPQTPCAGSFLKRGGCGLFFAARS